MRLIIFGPIVFFYIGGNYVSESSEYWISLDCFTSSSDE